jgi:hypothetical protein
MCHVCVHEQGSVFQDPEIINAFSGAIAGVCVCVRVHQQQQQHRVTRTAFVQCVCWCTLVDSFKLAAQPHICHLPI